MPRSSCVAALALLVIAAGQAAASPGHAGVADTPRFAVKLGIGIPGVPGVAAELFVTPRWTAQLEGGTGPLGPYASASARRRLCWGCPRGSALALEIGPEATFIFDYKGRQGTVAALAVDLAYDYHFAARIGWTAGLKVALGYGWDFEDGERVASDASNTILLYTGVSF